VARPKSYDFGYSVVAEIVRFWNERRTIAATKRVDRAVMMTLVRFNTLLFAPVREACSMPKGVGHDLVSA